MATHTLGTALTDALGSFGKAATGHGRTSPPATRVLRTRAPVRRDSKEAGTFEETFFVPPAKGETDRLLRAARRILDAGRQLRREARAGERVLTRTEELITTLTAASVRVFEEILTLARLNAGKVYPSYDHLAKATSLGRATVARALTILEDIGFLTRQRRFRRVEHVERPGPRYKQTSNVYRTSLSKTVQAYLPRWMRPVPISADMAHSKENRVRTFQHMQGQLTCRELAETFMDGPLAKVLASLGAAMDKCALVERDCESQTEAQPLTPVISW